jgi:hypothetical protein
MQSNRVARSRTSVGYAALVMVAAAISSLFGGCTPSPDAGKGVPPGTQPSAESDRVQSPMVAQLPLIAAADRIKALDPQGSGLGGLRIDIEQRTLEVWWKGDPPASVRDEIARQKRDGGIRVQLQPARYTQRELVEAARNIMKRAGEYPDLVSAGPLVDGSGLEIGVSDTARAASFKFPVPVRIVSAQKLVPLLSRVADGEPWSAGAATKPSSNPTSLAGCSTGFAMAGAFGKQGMLTADHCSCGGNVVFYNGNGVPIGLADTDHNNLLTDSLLISTSSPGATTFSGGVGVGEFKRTVVGKMPNLVGILTCTSGAGTGEHCGILVDAVNQVRGIEPPGLPGASLVTFCSQPAVLQGISVGHQMFGGVAAGRGDSGGPVYSPLDPKTVLADGMIIGGDTPMLCTPNGAFNCFNRVAFHDMDTLEMSHNASLFAQSASAPTQAGGATTISMVVFGGATGLWALVRRSRRSRSKPRRSTANSSVDPRR